MLRIVKTTDSKYIGTDIEKPVHGQTDARVRLDAETALLPVEVSEYAPKQWRIRTANYTILAVEL